MVRWRPFELRPEPLPPPDAAYIENGWTNSVLPLSRQLGVEMKRPRLFPRTRLAHEAAAFAEAEGRLAAMADGLFRAYWQQEQDIGQVEVLCAVGTAAGVDPDRLRRALQARTMRGQVEEELGLARRLGIAAVPSFVVGNRFLLRGLVGEEHLLRAIAMCRGEGLIDPQ